MTEKDQIQQSEVQNQHVNDDAPDLVPGVILGTAHKEAVLVEYKGQKYKVWIRPLSYIEAEEIESMLSKGVTVQGDARDKNSQVITVDTSQVVRYKRRAYLKAAAMGTVESDWTEKTIVQQWPAEWITKVGERVLKISGIRTPDERVKSFRTNNGS